ncbi:MAG TPA: AEC family transporter [Caldilineaceae bacterium]|nr:AEC family transporter [Caldilineaceae bacterium]
MFVFDRLLPIFVETVLPVFLIAFAGFLVAWKIPIEGRALGQVTFYLATPSLVFRSLYQMEIDFQALQQIALIAAAVTVAAGAMGWLIGFDQDRRRRAALILTSAVSNNGNMGIPICFFAFGQAGLALGTLYYVVSSFLSNTVGVVVASSGQASLLASLRQSLRTPMIYAATAGLLFNWLGGEAPLPLFRAIDLLANAAIPLLLVLLGVQLRSAPVMQGQAVILRSAVVRLVLGPLLAWQLCLLFGVSGVGRDVVILQAAMPTAVMTAVLATEFDAAPRLVASVIFVTTLASMVTLSLVLWLLL